MFFGVCVLLQEEAQRAERECARAMRARLVERVNIIQRRLDEENEKLQKKQQEFQRNRDQVDGAEEDFEKFCAEAMFRIGILEQRLQRHVSGVSSWDHPAWLRCCVRVPLHAAYASVADRPLSRLFAGGDVVREVQGV